MVLQLTRQLQQDSHTCGVVAGRLVPHTLPVIVSSDDDVFGRAAGARNDVAPARSDVLHLRLETQFFKPRQNIVGSFGRSGTL